MTCTTGLWDNEGNELKLGTQLDDEKVDSVSHRLM